MSTMETHERAEGTEIEGLAGAALLAAGVGAFVLGLLTTLNEASSDISDWLRFNDRVGPLSGKTIIATIAYFATLVVLGAVMRRPVGRRPVALAAGLLIVLGFVGTFPTFFEAFAD